jgi:hypothetical protein
MSIYENADDAESPAALTVPDYGDVAAGKDSVGGSEMMGGKDFQTTTDKRPLIAVAAVVIVGYLVYSNTGDPAEQGADTYQAVAPPPPPPYYTPPPPPSYYPPPPPPPSYYPPPPPTCTAPVPMVANGHYAAFGTTAVLQCNPGSSMGAYGGQITCLNNVWSGGPGTCTPATGATNPYGRPPPPPYTGGTTVPGAQALAPGARSAPHGRFVAINTPMHWEDARTYCEQTFPGGTLASIHSKEEQLDADNACREMPLSTDWADSNMGHPHACWIGMYEDHAQRGFVWSDRSAVSYLNFHAGEPNNDARITDAGHEEDKVEINFAGWGGAWNDNHNEGARGFTNHAASCQDGSCDTNADGMYPVCQTSGWTNVGGMTGDGGVRASTVFIPPTKVTVGRFVALPAAYDMETADEQCKAEGYTGLASIHSAQEQQQAASACDQLVLREDESGVPHGCWIGYRRAGPTVWTWRDGTNVDYQNWAPGEPNDYHGNDGSHSSSHGEEASEMDFRASLTGNSARAGGWNDNSVNGQAGHNADQAQAWGTLAVFGAFPLCQSMVPAASATGSVVGIAGRQPVTVGRFMAIQQGVDYDGAAGICTSHGALGLASIHSSQEQQDAASACSQIVGTDMNGGTPKGCWLGLHRDASRTRFIWEDGSPTDFINWAPGEPNDYHADAGSFSSTAGEEVVEMDFRMNDAENGIAQRGGGWNDQSKQGEAGHDTVNLFGNTVTTGPPSPPYFGTGGTFGAYVLCETQRPTVTSGPVNTDTGLHQNGFEVHPPATSTDGRYTAYQYAESWDDAQAYCTGQGHAGLASIHSASDQEQAAGACQQIVSNQDNTGVPHGCWIGLNQRGNTGTWSWNDNSPVSFVAWAPGEPNDYRGGAGSESSSTGEEVSEMDFRSDPTNGIMGGGGWNDNHVNGQAGHGQSINLFGNTVQPGGNSQSCFGCSGTYGMYILCEHTVPAGTTGAGGVINPFAPSPPYTRHDSTNANVEGTKYIASPSATSYSGAITYCQSQGMSLASIHSAADQDDAYQTCRQLHHAGVSGEPSGCWIGLNSQDQTGGTNHGMFRWLDGTDVDYIDWSPGEPNDWGLQSNQGAASSQGEDSVELNIDRSGQWNDQHANGDAQHDQQENGDGTGQHTLFGNAINCFGCTGAFGMWPLCERTTPASSRTGPFHGNVYDPITHQPVHVPTWTVPGADANTGNLNYQNNDYYGNGQQAAGQTPDCISSKSCAQLRTEYGGWPAMRGDAMVCGESDTIGANVDGIGANGDTRGSCTGGMNSAANGMANGGADGSNGQTSQGWAHADQMCKQAGSRLCTVRELLLDVTAGTGCQHDGELIWTFEACMQVGADFAVSRETTTGYHIVAQGGTARGREACPDQCGAVPDGTACICTPRCAPDTHRDQTNGNSFAHRCCADVSPQTLMQQVGGQGGCAAVAGYTGRLMAAPTVFGQQAACAGGVTLFGETSCGPPPPPAIGTNPYGPTPPPPPYYPPPPPPPYGAVTCAPPTPISNSQWAVQGNAAQFQCPAGQVLSTGGSSLSVTCVNGAWSPVISPFESCTPQAGGAGGYTPPPPPPVNNPFGGGGVTCQAPTQVRSGYAWANNGQQASMSCPPNSAITVNGQMMTGLSLTCVNGAWSPVPSPFWECTAGVGR